MGRAMHPCQGPVIMILSERGLILRLAHPSTFWAVSTGVWEMCSNLFHAVGARTGNHSPKLFVDAYIRGARDIFR